MREEKSKVLGLEKIEAEAAPEEASRTMLEKCMFVLEEVMGCLNGWSWCSFHRATSRWYICLDHSRPSYWQSLARRQRLPCLSVADSPESSSRDNLVVTSKHD